MYTSHYDSVEYPFSGVFYKITYDDSLPLDKRTEKEEAIFSSDCDMSSGASLSTDTFKIFFPFDYKSETLKIKEGDLLKAEIVGMQMRGRVIGVYPSQLGGCTVLLTRI